MQTGIIEREFTSVEIFAAIQRLHLLYKMAMVAEIVKDNKTEKVIWYRLPFEKKIPLQARLDKQSGIWAYATEI